MTGKNGTNLTDGRRVAAEVKTANWGLVKGFGVVDFIENNPPMVAVTLDNGVEIFADPSCFEALN